MMHRIRKASEPVGELPKLGGGGGVVEADETYIGKKPDAPKVRRKAGAAQKNMVFSLVERGGKVRSFHISGPMFEGIKQALQAGVSLEAHLQTDEARMYNNIGKAFASHGRVNHSIKEYVRGDLTTRIRSRISSQCSSVACAASTSTAKSHHLHRYLAEFDFRYNNRTAFGRRVTRMRAKTLFGRRGRQAIDLS